MDRKDSNRVIKVTRVGTTLRFDVRDQGVLELDTSKASETVRTFAMFHGFKQRVGDGAALSRNTETGLAATPLDKFNAMKEIIEHIEGGGEEWNLKGGGGSGPSNVTILAQALGLIYTAKTIEELTEWCKKRTVAERAKLLLQPNIKAHADAIRAEALKGIDTTAMLEDLETM